MSKQALENLKAKFGDRVEIYEHNHKRAYVAVSNDDWIAVTRHMYEVEHGRLTTATGSDRSTGVELLYHFAIDRAGTVVNIRTTLDKPFPRIEALTKYYPAADFIEREIFDFLGVEFVDHPDPRKILSSHDRPADFHPMRRDK
ncbi:NADH-quinone oxidoreductase subunit C [bacterium]|nr:NADH-quinone oxidoreductase subunit C [bacterium]